MELNIPNLTQLRDHLAQLPADRFAMSYWFQNGNATQPDEFNHALPGEIVNECGTTACLGGWTLALFAPKKRLPDSPAVVERRAAELLGLSTAQAYELFNSDYQHDAALRARPEHAVKVLDHLITTGEVDWDAMFQ